MSYDVDWPDAECHEILPKLYLGGHAWKEDGRRKNGRHSKVSEDKSWDYIVSAYIEDYSYPALPRCDTRFVIFNDTEKGLDDETWAKIKSAVDAATTRWLNGQKVMLRCQAGYNRSGMMMGLVLMSLGFTAEDAITKMRALRGKDVLINSAFERYVREREEEYLRVGMMQKTEAVMSQRAWADDVTNWANS